MAPAARHQFRASQFFAILAFLSCILIQIIGTAASAAGPYVRFGSPRGDWLNHGGDIYNRRYASGETKISPATASRLGLKWKFNAGGLVTGTPAVYDGVVYFTSWNGYVHAVKACDGSLVWKQNLKRLTGISGGQLLGFNSTIARSTPTVVAGDLDMLILGITGPAYVIAIKGSSGRLIWSTQLDTHPYAIITMSGTYYHGGFYVGVSSLEENAAIEECCTFRGSFVKLDARTGRILWKTFTLPDNHGQRGDYAGGAIWGSSASIDASRNHVYIATGNLYSAPQRIQDCQERLNNQTTPTNPDECIEPDNHSDSIMALDMDNGKIRWYRQLGGYDVWFFACNNLSTPNCPSGPNPDADFGEEPMMLSIELNATKRDVVAAVQKSGFAWALDRDDGNIIWFTEAGPGGLGGGGTWGAATDTRKIYTNIANSNRMNFTLLPSKKVTNGGGWVAMDAPTGKILWSTADPKNATVNPVTIANGVLFGGSTYSTGPVYAINAETGKILWSYETGASVYGGMSVSNGCMYVGHGYRAPAFTAGTHLFAFCI
ncbi:uncharacterized protein [Coffea arabica]|uniref:Pyrrolo-quinoline quinone repeat domain-containing protein n=1 Tax=Coffea arabica TaxID=13443 RepID=A0A6P6T9M9_COFAR|nr:uncharacterized protein LOC113698852 [Coffea arabica]